MSNHSSPAPPGSRTRSSLGMAWANIQCAAASTRSHRFRSLLTLLGVAIGVAAVIVLVAFARGAERDITSQIDTLGTNVVVLVPGKIQGGLNFNPTAGMGLSNLTMEDVEALRALPELRGVAPLTFISGGVFRGDVAAPLCLPIATTPELAPIRQLQIVEGRFLTADDRDRAVCVLGSALRSSLFGDENPLGEKISLNGRSLRVIGVAAERSVGGGLFGGQELDAILYLPLTGASGALAAGQIHRVLMEVDPRVAPEAAVEKVRAVIARSHGGRDDFTLLRAQEMLAMFYKIFNMFSALLLGITSISLIVGGIGIMNVMLVSVTERTREIGIRKTVGARRSDIFIQFLTEALILSLAGGAVGVLLALAACEAGRRSLPLNPLIEPATILLGFGVCFLVGLVSGVTPAIAGARKDPIEAIRHE